MARAGRPTVEVELSDERDALERWRGARRARSHELFVVASCSSAPRGSRGVDSSRPMFLGMWSTIHALRGQRSASPAVLWNRGDAVRTVIVRP